jgi:glycyl-tRNA synthetase beta chain
MAELLLELLSEEIPARMQGRAAEDLQRLVTDKLKELGLEFSAARGYVTPRRLALVVEGLPEQQPDVSEERRGPRTDAPEKAIQGFLSSTGLTLDQCEKRETPRGAFWFAVINKPGRPTAEVLAEVLPGVILSLPWPKSMRWGAETTRWVRPLHSILCLFNLSVVRFTVGSVTSGDVTSGHRFLVPEVFAVQDFADYERKLSHARVVLDPARRRRIITDHSNLLAKSENLTVKDDPGLLDEVAGVVEWPVTRMGRIDPSFMDIPPEVLTTAMRSHQKYFSLLDSAGKLAPRFILVANRETPDGEKKVVAGNERVLKARLSDARFFWEQDRRRTLESRVADLGNRVFHEKLGSVAEKVERLQWLASSIAESIPGGDPASAARAAHLSKADLASGMVGEFPELQGIMGRYYAKNDGEPLAVAEALGDHYAPQGPNDRCPTAPTSVAVALADKIDSLVGFFAIGETPTGSRDPFALRRAALGAIRLILENNLRLKLGELFWSAQDGYRRQGISAVVKALEKRESTSEKAPQEAIKAALDARRMSELLVFFAERLKVHLREEGVRHDLIASVFALEGEDDLVRLIARVKALQAFLGSEDGANLLTAYRRASNIVAIEEKKDKKTYEGKADAAILAQEEEKVLHQRLQSAMPAIGVAVAEERFGDAMSSLAGLRQPVDTFFDKVTVNADDAGLRVNRLHLLSDIRRALRGVADFSLIEG